MDWRGRVALVTGASSGIGRDTAGALAERGCVVVGVARREELLRELASAWQHAAPGSGWIAGDLGERDFAERVVRETLARHGRLDVLVNNAARPKHKHALDLSPGEIEEVLRVNFLAAVWTTLAALPHMIHQGGGTIVNVSSFAAEVVPPRESIYAASKRALDGFTEGLWSDLAGSNVHAALVIPGAIDTEIWEKLDEPPAFRGRRHPTRLVTEAILEAVEKRRFSITAPKRSPQLLAARWLRFLCPPLLRAGLRRLDPVPPGLFERAVARVRARAEAITTRR
jgi:short-subunit dehydrogenase